MRYEVTVALPGLEDAARLAESGALHAGMTFADSPTPVVRTAVLTDEHSASRYGQPVVLVDGEPEGVRGTAEVLWLDGSPEARAWAQRAGYSTLVRGL